MLNLVPKTTGTNKLVLEIKNIGKLVLGNEYVKSLFVINQFVTVS